LRYEREALDALLDGYQINNHPNVALVLTAKPAKFLPGIAGAV
jgi:hypothetical protein